MTKVRNNRAFTLIEVLIVVVIMAVLAATVIPQFASSTTDAKESSLKFNMHTLRSQIELYKIQHGSYPTLQSNGLPQLLAKTDASGALSTTGAFGPYLDGDIPANPFDNNNKIYVAPANPPTATTTDGKGWQYHEATGGIWPNNPEYWQ
ncbi:MAG: type II secretion system protein [Thermoguttaceae bacterium]